MITSHFSGFVTTICASAIRCFVNWRVSGKLADFDIKDFEAFLHKGLHIIRRYVNALVSVMVKLACFLLTMLGSPIKDDQHGRIGL